MQKFYPIQKSFRITKTGFLILLFTGFMAVTQAQVRTIQGVVTASDTKETLPGATVMIKGTTIGAVTDIDGKYSIKVSSQKDTLVFSYMGYYTRVIEVGNETVINVLLELQKTTLDEVVVIGYGTVKKSDLTGSVSTIKSGDITKITSLNPVQSLQGQVSGVQVTSISGTPGESPTVRIRGTGTFNNSSPIYVVDGVILDDISFLNAGDIKSMEVLKDASSTAIYGSRGANGVILVTTKSGKIGEDKTVFAAMLEVGIQRVAKKIALLNGKDFATIRNEIQPGYYNNIDLLPNTDWQDLIFHLAPVYNFQVSASGATPNTQYYVSAGYFGQNGIIDHSSYQRITLKLNNVYNLSKYVKLGNNITFAPFSQEIAPDVTYAAYRALPVLVPYYPNGDFGIVYNVGNPLASLNYSNNFNKGIRGVGNVYAEVTFLKSFLFKTSFGIDAGYYKSENFNPAYTVYYPDGTTPSQQSFTENSLTKSTGDNLAWLWENTLNFHKDIKKHSIDAVGGFTMQNTSAENTVIPAKNIIREDPSFWYINGSYLTSTYPGVNNSVPYDQYYSMVSYLIRANYVYSKKYILTATFRRDGSSKFSESNRWGNFPSFGLGWNLSQENFMQDLKFLSKLKLRGSWGKTGNEKINYIERYSLVNSTLITILSTGVINPASSYGKQGNPNLKWEVTTQSDAGLEVGFLNDRLTGEFDYYNRVTDDILVPLKVPAYFGNGSEMIWFNAGSMVNRGFEFNVGWRDQIGKMKYNVSFLGSTVHNEVLQIGGSTGIDSVLNGGYLANGLYVTQSKVGLPIGAFFGYKTDGLFQSQAELDAYPHMADAGVGDLRFVDVNNDGKIDGRDRTYIGSPIPKFIFGLNLGIEISGIDFSCVIQGQTGNKIFNAKEVVRPDPYNFEQYVMDRWTSPGSSTTQPKASFGGYNYTPSDYFVRDGSFVRIRNVTLGYTLPSNWSQKVAMQKLRIYLKVDNLYTIAKFTGYTPEIGGGSLSNGIDYGVYPITAVYSFGLNLTF
jgi:TonB-linked SusC/RagA family outer membrane protein